MTRISVSVPAHAVAEELAAAQARIANLETALTSSRQIAAAVGILMASRKITYDEALEALRQASRLQHRKVRDLADDVIEVGEILGPGGL